MKIILGGLEDWNRDFRSENNNVKTLGDQGGRFRSGSHCCSVTRRTGTADYCPEIAISRPRTRSFVNKAHDHRSSRALRSRSVCGGARNEALVHKDQPLTALQRVRPCGCLTRIAKQKKESARKDKLLLSCYEADPSRPFALLRVTFSG